MREVGTDTRKTGSFSDGPERVLLVAMARRLPLWVTPDSLTALGLFGAAVSFTGYAMSESTVVWLSLAVLGICINWLGDSLDGTLARVRRIERPRYGFFLDHATDIGSQLLIGLGLGLSPFMRFDVACLALIVYLAFTVFSLMKCTAPEELQIAYGGVGPTEIRLLIIAVTGVMFWFRPMPIVKLWAPMSAIDLAALAVAAAGLSALVLNIVIEARRISRLERSPERPR